MNDLDLEARVRGSLAARADLAPEAVVPDPARFRAQPARRRTAVLVAAAVVLIAGVIAWRGASSDHDVRITPETTVPLRPDQPYLVETWPVGFGPVEQAAIADGTPVDTMLDQRLLGRGDLPEVMSIADRVPMGTPDAEGTTDLQDIEFQGLSGRTFHHEGRAVLMLALQPGLTLTLTARNVDIPTLMSLADSYDLHEGTLDVGRLPDGWRELPVPPWAGIVGGYGMGRARAGRVVASMPSEPNGPQVRIDANWVATDDPAHEVDAAASLWGGERVQVGGREGVLRRDGAPREMQPVLVMFPLDDHHLGWVQGIRVAEADVLAAAESMRPASDDEWRTLRASLPTTTTIPPTVVDGVEFEHLSGEVVASGRRGDRPWVLTETTRTPSAGMPEGMPPIEMFDLAIRRGDGTDLRTGWSASGSGVAASRNGSEVLFATVVPSDVVRPMIRYEGRDLDVTVEPAGGGRRLVFATLPAVEVGDLRAEVYGTNADGSTYVYPRPPDAAAGMSFAEAIGAN